jgi:hypothetical protein
MLLKLPLLLLMMLVRLLVVLAMRLSMMLVLLGVLTKLNCINQRRTLMTDELTEVGADGIRRSFDEHYDTFKDVEQDPTGAMWAIHKQAIRIEELEAAANAAARAAAAWDAVEDAEATYHAAWAAYIAELKKIQEETSND